MRKRLISADATTSRTTVAERTDMSLRERIETTGAKRTHWVICLTMCAMLAFSWVVLLALLFLVIAGIKWVHRALLAN